MVLLSNDVVPHDVVPHDIVPHDIVPNDVVPNDVVDDIIMQQLLPITSNKGHPVSEAVTTPPAGTRPPGRV